MDCDPEWKKVTNGEISKLIGMTSKEIFPAYPAVTAALSKAWKDQNNVSMTLWYDIKTILAQKILQSEPRKRLLAVNATFVPPDSIVAYVNDITGDEDPAPGATQTGTIDKHLPATAGGFFWA